MIASGAISGKIAKDVFEIVWREGGDPSEIVESRGLKQLTDTGAIETAIDAIIACQSRQGRRRAGQARHARLVRRPGHEVNRAARPIRRPSTLSSSASWGSSKSAKRRLAVPASGRLASWRTWEACRPRQHCRGHALSDKSGCHSPLRVLAPIDCARQGRHGLGHGEHRRTAGPMFSSSPWPPWRPAPCPPFS